MYVCMYSQTSLTGSAYVDNQLKLIPAQIICLVQLEHNIKY